MQLNLDIWEEIYNPIFNQGKFAIIKSINVIIKTDNNDIKSTSKVIEVLKEILLNKQKSNTIKK